LKQFSLIHNSVPHPHPLLPPPHPFSRPLGQVSRLGLYATLCYDANFSFLSRRGVNEARGQPVRARRTSFWVRVRIGVNTRGHTHHPPPTPQLYKQIRGDGLMGTYS
jgi:hypothetical protein